MEIPDTDDGIYGRIDGETVRPQADSSRPDLGERGALAVGAGPSRAIDGVPDTIAQLRDISEEWVFAYTHGFTNAFLVPTEEAEFINGTTRLGIASSPNTIRISNTYSSLYVDEMRTVDAEEIPIGNLDVEEMEHSGLTGYHSRTPVDALAEHLDIGTTNRTTGGTTRWICARNTEDRETIVDSDTVPVYIRREDVSVPDEYPEDTTQYDHLPIDLHDDVVPDGWSFPDGNSGDDCVIQATEITHVEEDEVPLNE